MGSWTCAGDEYDLVHSSSPMTVSLPLEVAFEKNSKHAWEMGVVTLKKRERESLREAGRVFLVFFLRARLPSLPPAQESQPRAGEGAGGWARAGG